MTESDTAYNIKTPLCSCRKNAGKRFNGLSSAIDCAPALWKTVTGTLGDGGSGEPVNLELWSGMLLVSEHASSCSYERPLKDDGMPTTPTCTSV